MINIENVAEIHRLFYVEHMKINAISVHLAIHRDAVKRALSPAKFCNKRFRASILDAWEPYIAETVEEYPKIKSPRLTELLRDRGYQGSTSSVRHYLQKYRQRHHQAFLRLEYFPGEQAQVDWADFGKINVDGGQRRLSCFVMVMAHSRAVFARFGYDQKLESFLHGHIQAFNYFNGVPRSLLYDNLKSAVIERQAGLIKFNNNLLELCAHYRFIPKACQPYAGNQKGRVERTIRYLRENFFEARKFADLADLNHQLDIWRENTAQARPWPQNKEKTVREAFSEEQGVLIPLPGCEPDASRMEVTRSGKTPYIYFDGNNYSIPHEFVLVPITLRISQKNIMFYDKDKKIAAHERSWSKGKHIEDPIHIRALVEKKRVHQTYKNKSVLLARLPEAAALLPLWLELGNNIGKSSQRLMALLDQYQVEDVKNAIDQAIAVRSPSVDGITYLLQKSKIKPYKKTKIELSERLQRIDIRSHEPSQYDDLINQKESSDDRNSPATQK